MIVGFKMQALIEALEDGARLKFGDKWIIRDNIFKTWNVYEKIPYSRTTIIIETDNIEKAVKGLMQD